MGKTRRFRNEKAEEFAEWYKKLPWQAKMGVSLGLMTGGIIAGTVGAAPIMAACFAGQMGLRSLGGAMTTVGVEGLVKKWQEKSGEKKLSKEFEGNFLEALKNKNDTLDDKLFELVKGQQSAKNKRMVVAGLTGGIVGTGILATAVKEAFGWGRGGGKAGIKTGSGVPGAEEPTAELTSLEEPPGSEPLTAEAAAAAASEGLKEHSIEELVFLEIGQRGPEGAIIDNFRANPELAKSFGWDGKGDISKWAGTKAHQLWLASVESELAKPGMAEKLTEQGFTPDVEGYAKAMHKLGQGVVELDPQGRISLSDNTSFLKAGAPALEELSGAAETASAVEAPLPEAPGPEIPAVKVPTPTEAIVTSVSEAKASLSAEDLIDQKIKATVTHSVDPAFLTDKTFKAAAKMTLGKLLEEVPAEAYKDKYALSNYWHSLSGAGVKTPNLPGTGFLGDLSYDDWRKYAEMAKLLRENPVLKSVTGLKNMTMEEFFHFYGGDLGKK